MSSSPTIDRITTSGTVTAVPLASTFGGFGMTAGSDGNMWLENYGGACGQALCWEKLSTAGALLATYAIPTNGGGVPALGPDGNVWWSASNLPGIARITPSGVMTTFPVPQQAGVYGITAGPDGNVWFTEEFASKVGRITPSGVITEFAVPQIFPGQPPGNNDGPGLITTGPDGNLWVADAAGAIFRVTTAGAVTEVVAPTGLHPASITAGPDGNVWFGDFFDAKIGRITPSGQIGVFDASSLGMLVDNLVTGPDERIWFTTTSPAAVHAFPAFAPAASNPDVQLDSPQWSLPGGGTQVRITGYDVGRATQVLFGTTPATSWTVAGPSQIVATAPPHAVGAVVITVATPAGKAKPNTAAPFYYQTPNCGTVISRSTTLSGDIGPCYTAGVVVAADNVTLDLNSHGIIGFPSPRGDGSTAGITLQGRTGVTVSNGTVSGFNAGIHIAGGGSNTLSNLTIHDNMGTDDVFASAFGDGVFIEHSSRNQIVNNVIDHNGVFDDIGIWDPGSDNNVIANNVIENAIGPPDGGPAGEGIIINGTTGDPTSTSVHGNQVVNNTVRNSGSGGIATVNSVSELIAGNNVSRSGMTNAFGNGIGVQVGLVWDPAVNGPIGATVQGNSVHDNGVDGIRVTLKATGNRIANNTSTANGNNLKVDVFEAGPGFDLHDQNANCADNVWTHNSWSAVGVSPACAGANGTGPAPSGATAANSAPVQPAPGAAALINPGAPNAQQWEAFLENGRHVS